MTGWYPHVRGHRSLDHLLKSWEPNLLRYRKDGGYHVAVAGSRGDVFAPGVTEASTHFCGFSERPERITMGPQFGADHPLYAAFYHGRRGPEPWLDFDEAAVRTAITWLDNRPAGPWALFVPLIFPHLPFEVEEPFYSRDTAADMPLPRPHGSGKPKFHAALRGINRSERLTDDDWREIVRTYYGMIARVDEQLGRLLHTVDAIGAADTTSVWFFTDHGEYLGDFGLIEKWLEWLHETSDIIPWDADPRFPKTPHGQHTPFSPAP